MLMLYPEIKNSEVCCNKKNVQLTSPILEATILIVGLDTNPAKIIKQIRKRKATETDLK